MGRIYTERERQLQKKLIPLNIVVCIIALVCIFTILFAPIIKIDLGKILKNEQVIALINDEVSKAIGGNSDSDGPEHGGLKNREPENYAFRTRDLEDDGIEDGGNENNGDGFSFSLDNLDVSPIVSTVLTNVLKGVEGSIKISAQGAAKVLNAPEDEKVKMVLDELLLGDAVMGKFIDSVVNSITNVFENAETKQMIEEALIETVATTLESWLASNEDIPDEITEIVTAENITELTSTLRKLEDADADPESVADEFIGQLQEILGEDVNLEGADEAIRNFIVEGYEKTMNENNGEFSFEALICITVSEMVDLSEIDITSMFGELTEGSTGATAVKKLVDGDVANGDGTDDRIIVTSYSELLKNIGLDQGNLNGMKESIRATVEGTVNESVDEYKEYFGYYGYLYYAMLALTLPWIIIALLSFLHIFLKNKRITMWYVKLFGWIPAIFWLLLALAPFILKIGVVAEAIGEYVSIVTAVLGCVSSLMWICGLCYLLIWLISIFWAFPIKRKIRKERKLAKRAA